MYETRVTKAEKAIGYTASIFNILPLINEKHYLRTYSISYRKDGGILYILRYFVWSPTKIIFVSATLKEPKIVNR